MSTLIHLSDILSVAMIQGHMQYPQYWKKMILNDTAVLQECAYQREGGEWNVVNVDSI